MSLFQTTANVANNSFQDPLNPFNTTQGSWGIDPTYLTPNYAAPYRPQYQGPQGAPPPNQNVSFGSSVYNTFTPFGDSFNYGNSVTQDDPYYSAMAYRPLDGAAWAVQRGVIPALAFAAGMKASSVKVASNSGAYSAAMKGWNNSWSYARHAGRMATGAAPEASHALFQKELAKNALSATEMGIGARVGSSVGQGLAKGVVGGMGLDLAGVGARGFVGTAGLVGAGIGSLASGLIVGEAITGVADAALVTPYSATRNTQRSLNSNFQNIMAGTGTNGNSVNGFGMSSKFSAKLGSRLTGASIKDMMFDSYGMGDLTDMAARSGQLDDVQLEQIESRMKKLAKQVKVMMRVANEPDFRAAMEMMAELKTAGAGPGSVGKVLQNIAGSSAIAGVSVQKMMNTVGAQGQYIYQSNNLTPYLGQTQAASTYGAFSSAYRMGLISDSTMSQFGGREGATQLAVTGHVNAAQTPYNQIMLMNENFGRGNGGGVVNNLSSFGQMASGDPMGIAGAMGYYKGDMISKQLMQKGSGAFLDQIKHMADVMPGMKNKDGSIDVEKAHLMMTTYMGIPDMEAKSMLKELQSYGGKGVSEQMTSALHGQMQSDVMKYLEQEGLNGGRINSITYPVAQAWKSFKAGGNEMVGGLIEGAGGVKDSIESGMTGARFGSLTRGTEPNTFNEFEGDSSSEPRGGYKVNSSSLEKAKGMFLANPFGKLVDNMYGFVSDPNGKMGESHFMTSNVKRVDALNDLARSGDSDAKIATNPNSSRKDRADAIDRLNADKKLGDPLTSGRKDKFVDQILASETSEADPKEGATRADKIQKGINDSVGKDVKMLDGLNIIEASRKVAIGQGDERSRSLLRSVYGKDLDNTALMFKADEVYKKSAENEVIHLAGILNNKTPADLEKSARAGSAEDFGELGPEVKNTIKDIEADKNLSDKDKSEKISRAVTLFRSKATGMPMSAIYDKKILTEGISSETLSNGLEGSRDIASKKLQIGALAAQKVINFDTKYSSMAALDMKEAVNTFGDFVNKLDGVANKFAGSAPDSPATGNEERGPLGSWIKSQFSKTQTTGGK